MKNLISLCAFLVTVLFLNGCISHGHIPPGFIFTSTKGPIDTGFAKAKAAKEGHSCGSNILGVVATGDTSINSAKLAGGIKRVATVDYETFSVLGIYTKACVHVTGD